MTTKSPRHYSPYDGPMWQSITSGEMKLQQCNACGKLRYPPGPACPHCLSTEHSWVPISGKAKLLSWTVFHRQYLPAYPAPSVVVAAQLAEGPIMVANIDAALIPRLRIDADLQMLYEAHADGYTIPRFTLAGK